MNRKDTPHRNNSMNREFDEEGSQNSSPEQATIADWQSVKEAMNDEGKTTLSKTDSSGLLAISSNPFLIRTIFSSTTNRDLTGFLASAQQMIESMIPESYQYVINGQVPSDTINACLYRFSREIPILKYAVIPEAQKGILLKILCHADFTEGVGRYITEMFSRWMVPGKKIPNVAGLGLHFSFVHFPQQEFYFRQEFFQFDDSAELSQALRNLSLLIEETRINILAVYQARYLASLRSLSYEHRSKLIEQNISSLFKEPNPSGDRNAYDRIHQFLIKLSEEEKLGLVKKNMNYLMRTRPQDFDRDIFQEMTGFTSHLKDPFTTARAPRHISRIVAFHYLFKKSLLQSIQDEPDERHLSIKIVKAKISGSMPILGILIGMNLLRESERFDRKHLLSAIQSCLPAAIAVSDSYIVDRRDDKLRIFYLEIQKPQNEPFTSQEIKTLRERLPDKLKRRIENIVHPIFMPRNEEEVLRTIVVLSKQIRFLRDLPQVTIHYEKQTDTEITFLIILVRILKEHDLPFKELMQSSHTTLHMIVDEIRSAGTLKRRFPKEAVVFRAMLDKTPFFRKDFSLNLKRARQKVGTELRHFLGDFRDFNGGMMHKQDEALELFRKSIGSNAAHHEVLLENFFYSLRPGIMQTIHTPEILSSLFHLLLETFEEDLMQKGFCLKVSGVGKYFLAMINAAAPTFREEAMAAVFDLKIPSYDLTSSFLHINESATLGYIFRTEDVEKRSQFQQVLLDAMIKWKVNFFCHVKCSESG